MRKQGNGSAILCILLLIIGSRQLSLQKCYRCTSRSAQVGPQISGVVCRTIAWNQDQNDHRPIVDISSNTFHQVKCLVFVLFLISWECCMCHSGHVYTCFLWHIILLSCVWQLFIKANDYYDYYIKPVTRGSINITVGPHQTKTCTELSGHWLCLF